ESFTVCFFFFQAEDGIRDRNVTGVQTCALPIWIYIKLVRTFLNTIHRAYTDTLCRFLRTTWIQNYKSHLCSTSLNMKTNSLFQRSEERRVGKECRTRRATDKQNSKKQQEEVV